MFATEAHTQVQSCKTLSKAEPENFWTAPQLETRGIAAPAPSRSLRPPYIRNPSWDCAMIAPGRAAAALSYDIVLNILNARVLRGGRKIRQSPPAQIVLPLMAPLHDGPALVQQNGHAMDEKDLHNGDVQL
ncbi:hypothetical protein EVAR_74421_1 [Eumeta japonica]|uniref:Uncharacterized protein n=1 Tax=Eumeta variegata TaxID=151549 RepID=A0A4C1SDJ0_EUMVA|nr:hypothetical protein EVAR_74421_1 [Eumeta japonica]